MGRHEWGSEERRAWLRGSLLILGLCFALRVLDVFVIRSEEWFGEQILTKGVGLALVLAYAMRSGLGLKGLGFRGAPLSVLVGVGIGFTALAMLVSFVLHYSVLALMGAMPDIDFMIAGYTPGGTGEAQAGFVAAATLLVSNLVNGLMEEGLFRGLLLLQLAAVVSSNRANLIQAALFGLWHVVWPLRAVIDGEMAADAALVFGTGYVLVSAMVGYVWGCLFLWFRSLWVPVLSHSFHNAVLNVVHVTTGNGTSTVAMLTSIEAFVFLALLPLMRRYRRGPCPKPGP